MTTNRKATTTMLVAALCFGAVGAAPALAPAATAPPTPALATSPAPPANGQLRYGALVCSANGVGVPAPYFDAGVTDDVGGVATSSVSSASGSLATAGGAGQGVATRTWTFVIPPFPPMPIEAGGVRVRRLSAITARFVAPSDASGVPAVSSTGPTVTAEVADGNVVARQAEPIDLDVGTPGYRVEVRLAHGGSTEPPPSWEFAFTAEGSLVSGGAPFSAPVVCSSGVARPAVALASPGLAFTG